jgi:putative transposase
VAEHTQDTRLTDVMELLIESGFDGVGDALRILLNAAMLLERERYLGAAPYQRTDERRGHANGFKPKTVSTRVGQLELQVPQVREGGFYPSALERGSRSERALKLSLAEMYVQGVSTRKVAAITEQLCGFEVSSAQVSRATVELDTVLAEWRQRPLGEFAYVQVDARYEHVREGGIVVDQAVLWGIGIDTKGRRHVLGVSVERSEAEVHWRGFLSGLVARGLRGVRLITSDDHAGLEAARKAVFPSVPWQRCQFHLQQNATQYVPRLEQRAEVASELRAIFNAPSREEAERLLKITAARHVLDAPKLSEWMEVAVPQGLVVFSVPEEHRKKLRTTNLCERINRELKRRTRVVSVFPNARSCERLVTAVLIEISEDWETSSRYLTMPEVQRTSGCVSTPIDSSEPKRGSGQARRARHERVAAKRA